MTAPSTPTPGTDIRDAPAAPGTGYADLTQRRRTIAVTARGHGRLSRLRLRNPDRDNRPTYDTQLALELLGRTSELPASKHALIVVLTEYRHAIADLVHATITTPPTRSA